MINSDKKSEQSLFWKGRITMAIRNIVKDTDNYDTLHKKCRAVTEFNQKLWDLLDDMAETMYQAEGVGLAGPQVGMLRRVFVIDVGEGILEFINPEILETSGTQNGAEGCLSFPGEYGMVERPNFVRVKAQDRNGNWFEMEGEELFARAVCHENDHLDGIVFKDRMSRILTEEELAD